MPALLSRWVSNLFSDVIVSACPSGVRFWLSTLRVFTSDLSSPWRGGGVLLLEKMTSGLKGSSEGDALLSPVLSSCFCLFPRWLTSPLPRTRGEIVPGRWMKHHSLCSWWTRPCYAENSRCKTQSWNPSVKEESARDLWGIAVQNRASIRLTLHA